MTSTNPKISVVMIVKNEEECLSRCLASVIQASEIIVVDTGSEDNTIEVAKRFTPHVFNDYKWEDSFCKARNHALAKATGDWVLSIDADEYLHDWNEVVEAVKIAERAGALAVNVKLFAEDSQQMHLFPRLFKRCPEVWWEGHIHNHVSVLGQNHGDVRITYGYSPAHLKDPNRALRILEKVCSDNPEAVREKFYLGREYYYRNWYDKCLLITGQYVQKSQYLPEKAEAFLMMAYCYWNLKMGEDARDACLQAIKLNANFKEALVLMAKLSGEGTGHKEWEANARQWRNMTSTATNENVLFTRDVQ